MIFESGGRLDYTMVIFQKYRSGSATNNLIVDSDWRKYKGLYQNKCIISLTW